MKWGHQVNANYDKLAMVAEQTLQPFPTMYLTECAFWYRYGHFHQEISNAQHLRARGFSSKVIMFSPR